MQPINLVIYRRAYTIWVMCARILSPNFRGSKKRRIGVVLPGMRRPSALGFRTDEVRRVLSIAESNIG